MFIRSLAVLASCLAVAAASAPAVWAQPEPEPVADSAPIEPAAEAAPPPADEGRVESTPAATTTTPDDWTLTLSAENETQQVIPPLTTALSSREYAVGGTFNGTLSGPGDTEPEGIIEAGYEIGCGIDMSTSNGVSLTGTAGINPSLGIIGTDVISPVPDGILPGIGGNIGGGITVGLKPGIINIVPVTKKEFEGSAPWVMVSGFRVKIDGCVGQSFIRSYAFLTRSTKQSDAVLAWYGATKTV